MKFGQLPLSMVVCCSERSSASSSNFQFLVVVFEDLYLCCSAGLPGRLISCSSRSISCCAPFLSCWLLLGTFGEKWWHSLSGLPGHPTSCLLHLPSCSEEVVAHDLRPVRQQWRPESVWKPFSQHEEWLRMVTWRITHPMATSCVRNRRIFTISYHQSAVPWSSILPLHKPSTGNWWIPWWCHFSH